MPVPTAIYAQLKKDFKAKFGRQLPNSVIDDVAETQALAIQKSMRNAESIRLRHIGTFRVNTVAVTLIKMRTRLMEEGDSFDVANKKAKDYISKNILMLVDENKANRKRDNVGSRKPNAKFNNMVHLPLIIK